MRLAVIVTSYNSPSTLEQCLASLAAQPEASEIVVADCSPEDPAPRLRVRFPAVRFLHFAGPRSVPELRWKALAETTGVLIAAVEARCVPAADWCRCLAAAHAAHPDAPAVGGPVALASDASALDTGLYFNEYGLFAHPVASGWRADLSGANLSYKRADLEAERDLLDAGAWETWLHERWRSQGRGLWLAADAVVTFRNSMPLGVILRQRFHYGRGYAGARGGPRLIRLLLSPLLPAVLTLRIARSLGTRLRWRAFGWLLLFTSAWAAGEAAGYLFGPPERHEIF